MVSKLCVTLCSLIVMNGTVAAQDARDIVLIPRDNDARIESTRVAVVVGLDEYEHPSELPSLTYAEKDARDVARELKAADWLVYSIGMEAAVKPWSAERILSEVRRAANNTRAEPRRDSLSVRRLPAANWACSTHKKQPVGK